MIESDNKELIVDLNSVAETERLCQILGSVLEPGSFLALCGDLGAGKTTFTRAMTVALECRKLATSPTFSLFQKYDGGRLPVFHADLYRLGSEDELWELGWDEVLEEYADGLVIVEWADKFEEAWPSDVLRMSFSYGVDEEQRRVEMTAYGERATSTLLALEKGWTA